MAGNECFSLLDDRGVKCTTKTPVGCHHDKRKMLNIACCQQCVLVLRTRTFQSSRYSTKCRIKGNSIWPCGRDRFLCSTNFEAATSFITLVIFCVFFTDLMRSESLLMLPLVSARRKDLGEFRQYILDCHNDWLFQVADSLDLLSNVDMLARTNSSNSLQ